ncbi:hypothetical protein BKA70DRAFT_1405195 [Coprinopsis sp. MPI-PUGE-AT-0042]|nr:hypothetical protein BKA70DRAFT_1405195 [Coprinopsis sp. MPI-PUGE-AT-0042]
MHSVSRGNLQCVLGMESKSILGQALGYEMGTDRSVRGILWWFDSVVGGDRGKDSSQRHKVMSFVVTTPIALRFYLVWRREWIKKAGHPSNSKSDMSGWGIGAFLVESGLPSTLTGILAAGSTIAIYASHDNFAERSIFSDRFEAQDGWLVNAFVQGIWPNIMALGPQLVIFRLLSGGHEKETRQVDTKGTAVVNPV